MKIFTYILAAVLLSASALFGQISGSSAVEFMLLDEEGNQVLVHKDSVRAEMADSGRAAAGDSMQAVQAEMYDSLALKGPYYYTGIAGDTTSPGKFYTINTDGKWTRADTSISTVAIAVAMDSVFIDSTCRFQYSGVFILEAWSGNWTYGDRIFSDSARAGEVGRGGQAAPKKMQSYGVAIDSTSILLNIDHTIAY